MAAPRWAWLGASLLDGRTGFGKLRAMTEPALHKNALRVQGALEEAGIAVDVRVLEESARTAEEAAAAIGVQPGQIAKSLVFLADDHPVMVVASGDEKVDVHRLAAVMGAQRVKRADAEVVRSATGYPIGGVSPVALPAELPVYVQTSLQRFPTVWAAAGTWHAVFATTYDDLLRLTNGVPSDVGTAS